jgi:transposase
MARKDIGCERLMTVPGIGPIISSATVATIGSGDMFAKGRDFGAWLAISRCGDSLLRSHLFEAANVILSRDSRTSALKAWGLALAKRIGLID